MAKLVGHQFRYGIQFLENGVWRVKSSSRFKWKATHMARYWESLGVYRYRVIDYKGVR